MHAGLRSGVRYLREFGFVYIDDGSRVLRLSTASFDSLIAACLTSPKIVLRDHPSLFVDVRSPDEVQRRFMKAEFG